MAVYEFDGRPDYFSLQVTTTRNVHDSPLVGWFMGGLQYQVEHHLFPYVPRHQLPKVVCVPRCCRGSQWGVVVVAWPRLCALVSCRVCA
jgi:hypothetical protein